MRPQDYFEYHAPLDIRLKGHRLGIDMILFDYRDGMTAQEIVERYQGVSLDEVTAVITYYERSRIEMEAFLHAIEEYEEGVRREQAANPSPSVRRLQELWRARDAELAAVAIPQP